MLYLKDYVERKNGLRSVFGFDLLPNPDQMSAEQLQEIADCVEADLSPENLSCDGELPREEVQKRRNYLLNVQTELAAFSVSGS